ncbi:hypothetical protein ACVWZ4_005100 [Bradyrhizobium sp. USDA 4472]
MSTGHHKETAHPPIITVGELIDELCRLPDTAVVRFRCPMLNQELTFYHLRKRSKDTVEIAINAYPESPPIVPASNGGLHARRHAAASPAVRADGPLHKARG